MDLMAFFKSETAATVSTWAATILVAGFIAQFGKKTADYFIERFGRHKPPAPPAMPAGSTAQTAQPTGEAALSGSTDKKQLKAELKKIKKTLAKLDAFPTMHPTRSRSL
jgi:hypothetical protein